jgi:hypothetical protein
MRPIRLDDFSRNRNNSFGSGLKGVNPYAVIGGLFIGSLVFGVTFYLLKGRASEGRAFASESVNVIPSEKKEVVAERKADATVAVPLLPRGPVRREIVAPWNDSKVSAHSKNFTAVALNADGSRVLTASEAQVISWDAATGKPRRIFERGEPQYGNLFIAPDALSVVVLDYPSQSLTIRHPDTGKELGSYRVRGELNDYSWGCQPTFAAGGAEFIFAERIVNEDGKRYYQLNVVSTRESGYSKSLGKPFRIQTENQTLDIRALYAVPDQPVVVALVKHKPQSFFAISTRSGEPKQLPWILSEPLQARHPGYGLTLTANGKRVVYKPEKSTLVSGTWPEGANRFMPPAGQQRLVHDWLLTPDGERVVRLNTWNQEYKAGYEDYSGYQTDYLELLDLTRNKVLGRVEHTAFHTDHKDNVLQGVAVSGDGRTLALLGTGRIALVDFQQAFKTDPLPPVGPPMGYLK